MSTIQEILNAATALPVADRAELIQALWATVDADGWPAPTQAWQQEADARSDAIDAGEMATSSWAEVRQRARKQAGLDS